MKREEKNALSRRRIVEAAMQEFSAKGYECASLNTVCSENGISKGIIYHYFKDKDELYLACVKECFDAITAHMKETETDFSGAPEEKLKAYFSARLFFFAENPVYLGIFTDSVLNPQSELIEDIAHCRKEFDEMNISILTEFLNCRNIRNGLSVSMIVEDFRNYMDFFNMQFKEDFREKVPYEVVLREHEERCYRQLDILLHGVLGKDNE